LTTLADFLTVSMVLLAIGLYGLVRSRNAIRMLFAVEIIISAANINLVAFSRFSNPVDLTGQVFALFSIAIGAAEAAVGLAIIILVFRLTGDVDIAALRRLRK
jgi:NADH:ubiquinone oxidoreductase subunit K